MVTINFQEHLTNLANRNDLVNRSKQSCIKIITDLTKCDPADFNSIDNFDIEMVALQLHSLTFVFQSRQFNIPFIRTHLTVNIDSKEIGKYLFDTGITGQQIDEWFTLY